MSALRLSGTLRRDARMVVGTDQQSAYVVVEVQQDPASTCAEARHLVGKGFGAQFAARNTAHRLRRGSRVTVHAAGWELDAARERLVLVGVDLIEQHDIPAAAAAQPEKELLE